MEYWCSEVLEDWSFGMMEYWSDGVLEDWGDVCSPHYSTTPSLFQFYGHAALPECSGAIVSRIMPHPFFENHMTLLVN